MLIIRKGGKKGKGRKQNHNKVTGRYVRQRIRTESNKKKRWLNHLAVHPNDSQNQKILKTLI